MSRKRPTVCSLQGTALGLSQSLAAYLSASEKASRLPIGAPSRMLAVITLHVTRDQVPIFDELGDGGRPGLSILAAQVQGLKRCILP
jgi:hypothetical protein